MNEEKQIEELARSFCGFSKTLKCSECSYECHQKEYARKAFEAGYRKASDVVNEVFADVFKSIRKYYIEAEHTKSVTCELMLDDLKGDLAELKKKYTEGVNENTK